MWLFQRKYMHRLEGKHVLGRACLADCKGRRAVWWGRLRGVAGARNPGLQEPDGSCEPR